MTTKLTLLKYGPPNEHHRALIIEGPEVSPFVSRPTAHPHTVLVITNRAPNDCVFKDKYQTAEPVLDGGFSGMLAAEMPKAPLSDADDVHLYESLGLINENREAFRVAFNEWIKKESGNPGDHVIPSDSPAVDS